MKRNEGIAGQTSSRLTAAGTPAGGGDSREESGKTPPDQARAYGNLGPLRGTETMHRFTGARVLSLAAALGATRLITACGSSSSSSSAGVNDTGTGPLQFASFNPSSREMRTMTVTPRRRGSARC